MTVTIVALPTPPSSSDPSTFNARADAFLSLLPGAAASMNAQNIENNAINVNVNTKVQAAFDAGLSSAAANAITANTQAGNSATSAVNSQAWASSTTLPDGISKSSKSYAADAGASAATAVATLQPAFYSVNGVTSFNASHSFSYNPQTWLIDASGSVVETDVVYTKGNVNLIFALPFTGTLYLK